MCWIVEDELPPCSVRHRVSSYTAGCFARKKGKAGFGGWGHMKESRINKMAKHLQDENHMAE